MREAIELGRVWGANTDHLYRFQVIELYSFGHDEHGAEVSVLLLCVSYMGELTVSEVIWRY